MARDEDGQTQTISWDRSVPPGILILSLADRAFELLDYGDAKEGEYGGTSALCALEF